ncbi:MAG TPA: FtsQ-type POTRA domain-containing protein [Gemmatimonadaceae bacterium]|nr:FtsQ-type POTRA domain-containing protein [Gemmatimonadaceae bacterium]
MRVLSMPGRAVWLPLAVGAAVLVLVSAPLWAPRALAHLSYFRVRHVQVDGLRYLAPAVVLARLQVDTTASVWDDVRPLERRVAAAPDVRSVTISRKLPGTLVVHVTEDLPIAFIPSTSGLHAVDSAGQVLSIDASRVNVDLPVLAKPDTALLRLLCAARRAMPALFSRISDVKRVGRSELVLTLPETRVRADTGLTIQRLADIIPVERDLARRGARASELDLRFRDQVIARLQ